MVLLMQSGSRQGRATLRRFGTLVTTHFSFGPRKEFQEASELLSADGQDGSHDLLFTMLVDAINLYVRAKDNPHKQEEWEEVRDWLESNATDPGSFLHACECLDIPVNKLRDVVFSLTPDSLSDLRLDV